MSAFYDSNVSENNLKVTYMRTFFIAGAPLEVNGVKFADKTDRPV